MVFRRVCALLALTAVVLASGCIRDRMSCRRACRRACRQPACCPCPCDVPCCTPTADTVVPPPYGAYGPVLDGSPMP